MTPLPTPLERHAFGRYSAGTEIAGCLRALAERAGRRASVRSAGQSALGRDIPVLLCGLANRENAADKLRLLLVGSRVLAAFADHRTVIATDLLRIPPHYFVTEHTGLFADLLTRHGVCFETLARAVRAPVLREVLAGGREPPAACRPIDELTQRRRIPAGALRVPLWGSDRRLVPLLLEPRSTSSVFCHAPFGRLLRQGQPFFIARGLDEP